MLRCDFQIFWWMILSASRWSTFVHKYRMENFSDYIHHRLVWRSHVTCYNPESQDVSGCFFLIFAFLWEEWTWSFWMQTVRFIYIGVQPKNIMTPSTIKLVDSSGCPSRRIGWGLCQFFLNLWRQLNPLNK